MIIEKTRFGTIEYDPARVIEFEQGLIGFDQLKRYILIEHRAGVPVHWLQSLDAPELAFPLVDPDRFIKNYVVEPPANLEQLVGGYQPQDLWLGVMVSFSGGNPSVNLKAPVVINTATGKAVQLVLEQDLPVHLEIGPGHERPR